MYCDVGEQGLRNVLHYSRVSSLVTKARVGYLFPLTVLPSRFPISLVLEIIREGTIKIVRVDLTYRFLLALLSYTWDIGRRTQRLPNYVPIIQLLQSSRFLFKRKRVDLKGQFLVTGLHVARDLLNLPMLTERPQPLQLSVRGPFWV